MQSWQWAVLAVPAIVLLVSILMIVRILTMPSRTRAHGPVEPAPREEVPPVMDGSPLPDRADAETACGDGISLFARPDSEPDDEREPDPSASAEIAAEIHAEHALSGNNALIEGSGARPRNAAD